MGDRKEKLTIQLSVDGDGKVHASLQGVTRSFSDAQAKLITLNQGVQLATTGFRLLGSAVSAASGFIGDAISEANKQESAIAALNQALRQSGQFTAEYSAELQALASQFQATTVFGDELVLEVERMLIQFGAGPNQVQRLTAATLDFATATGQDASSAAMLLGKAIAGNFSALSRYGITVEKNATQAEKLEQVLSQLEGRFGGQALAAVDTFDGRLTQLANTWGDLKEEIGFAITTSDFANDALEALTGTITGLGGDMATTRGEMAKLSGDAMRTLALSAADGAAAMLSIASAFEVAGTRIAQYAVILTTEFTAGREVWAKLWKDISSPVETSTGKAIASLAELRARIETMGTDAPRELGQALAGAAEAATRLPPPIEKASAAVKALKNAEDEYARAQSAINAQVALGGTTLETLEAQLKANEKMFDALAVAAGGRVTPEMRALHEEILTLQQAVGDTKDWEKLQEELDKTAETADEGLRKTLEDLDKQIRQLDMTPAERELDDLTTAINKAREAAIAAGKSFDEDLGQKVLEAGRTVAAAAEETSKAASTIGDAFADAWEGIALGTRELDDIPDLIKDAFAKAFFETLREKSGFDEAFKGNIFDLVGNLGDFLLGDDGLLGVFGKVFEGILTEKEGFDLSFLTSTEKLAAAVGRLLEGIGLGGEGGFDFSKLAEFGVGAAGAGAGAYIGGRVAGDSGTSRIIGQIVGGILGKVIASQGFSLATTGALTPAAQAALVKILPSVFSQATALAVAEVGAGSTIGMTTVSGTTIAAPGAAASGTAAAGGGASGAVSAAAPYAIAAIIANMIGHQLERSGSPEVATAGGQLRASHSFVDFVGSGFGAKWGSQRTAEFLFKDFIVDSIIPGLTGALAHIGQPSKSQLSRRGIGGFLQEMPSFAALGPDFSDWHENIGKLEPQLQGASGAMTAFGGVVSRVIDTGVSDTEEMLTVYNMLARGFEGLTAPQALAQTATLLDDLALQAGMTREGLIELQRAALLEDFTAGRLSLEQFQTQLQGLDQLAAAEVANLDTVFETFFGGGSQEEFASAIDELATIGVTKLEGLAEFMRANLGPAGEEAFRAITESGIDGMTELSTLSAETLEFLVASIQGGLTPGMQQAFNALRASGLSTFAALSLSGNAKFLELQAKMQGGFLPAAQGVFAAMADSGIGSFEGLSTASQAQVQQILSSIGGIQNGAAVFDALRSAGISDMASLAGASQAQIQRIIDALRGIPTHIVTEHEVRTTGIPETGSGIPLPPNPVPQAAGGWDVPGPAGRPYPMVAHGQEMILPADIAGGLRELVRRGGAQASGPQVVVVPVAWPEDLPRVLHRLEREGRMVRRPEGGTHRGMK